MISGIVERRAGVARARRRQLDNLAPLLHALARELRAGSSLHLAVVAVAADNAGGGPELRSVVRRIEAGDGVTESIDRWAAALDHPDADLVRAVLNTGATTGAAMAAALDRAAGSLRERVELQREIRALSSQARVSALVLTVAPIAFLLLMVSVDQSVLSVFGSTIGQVCLFLGLLLDGAGWWWMRRLVSAVAR